MRKALVLLAMIFWVVLICGTGFGIQSSQAQETTLSQGNENATKPDTSDGTKDTQARGQKDQISEYQDENGKGFATAKIGSKRRPTAGQVKPAQSRQLRSSKTTANDLQTQMPRNTLDSLQTSSTRPFEVSNKPLKHPSVPALPPAVVLNGQSFKNSRNPGARMASTGGSANLARGTGAINGSDIKRKP
jgi:hypothetical protein